MVAASVYAVTEKASSGQEIQASHLLAESTFSGETMRIAYCPFCQAHLDRELIAANAAAIAFADRFPLSRGHTLVVPRQHVDSVFSLPTAEVQSIWDLVATARQELARIFAPAGFNIGINDGMAAGQTVPHAHVHIIPRYAGDVPDPRSGVRWIVPAKAAYWT